MNDKTRELINRVIDYVIDHPATSFQLWQWDSEMYDKIKRFSPRWAFSFHFRGDRTTELHYLEHDGDPYWSGHKDCTEENLEILLKELEEMENEKQVAPAR